MAPSTLPVLAVTLGTLVLVVLPLVLVLARCYRKVDQGTALVITGPNGPPRVSFTGALVLPILHHAERISIGVQAIQISLRGAEAPRCNDGVRVAVDATLLVKINATTEDVLRVAQSIGCRLASDGPTLDGLFRGRLVAAIEQVAAALSFEDLLRAREQARDEVIQIIGRDLGGYALDDVTLSRMEVVPMEVLDPNNPLDAQGICKLTEMAAAQNMRTQELRMEERIAIARHNFEADSKILEIEKVRSEAEAKHRG